MKTRIMIVEDNYYRYFTVKQVIESSMRIPVSVVEVDNEQAISDNANEIRPQVLLVRPAGGILELVEFMKTRGYNCRNSTVSLIYAPEIESINPATIESVCNRRCAMISAAA